MLLRTAIHELHHHEEIIGSDPWFKVTRLPPRKFELKFSVDDFAPSEINLAFLSKLQSLSLEYIFTTPLAGKTCQLGCHKIVLDHMHVYICVQCNA